MSAGSFISPRGLPASPVDPQQAPRGGGGRSALPSYPGGSAEPDANTTTRNQFVWNDLKGAADKYAAQAHGAAWDQATKGIDTNNNADVEALAAKYGVKRGTVGMQVTTSGPPIPGVVNAESHPMNNEELLQAAKSAHRSQFMAQVQNDPQYKAIASGQDPSTGSVIGQRLGMNPYDVRHAEAGAQTSQNLANAIPVEAQAVADKGKGELATGQGALAKGQADAADVAFKGKYTYPAQAADLNSQAAERNATAGHITAMQPYDVARSQAETAAIPGQAAAKTETAATEKKLKESQIAKNNAAAAKDAGGGLPPDLGRPVNPQTGLPLAQNGEKLDQAKHPEIIAAFKKAAGGDPKKATELARQHGWGV